jgi:hypothetical protein
LIAVLALWMPIALGIPHVAQDVRLLLVPMPRPQRWVSIAACSALVALKLSALCGHALPHAEAVVVATWLLAVTRTSLAIPIAVAIVMWPVSFAYAAFAAHAVVGVILWIVMRRPRALAIAAIVVGAGLAWLAGEPLVFLQAVHYAVWLAWIPRALPPTAALAGAGVMIAAGCVDAQWARTTYLALASFHIYLEIIVLAAQVARRRR